MDIALNLFPSTLSGWAVQTSVSLVGSLVVMSFTEHFIHGYVMHQRIFPAFMYARAPLLAKHFSDHVDLHHGVYYKQFNHEPDPYGRNINMRISDKTLALGLLIFLPVLVVLAWYLSLVPVIVFLSVFLLHRQLWNIIHLEMHQPKHPSWTQWPAYKFLARYHYLHHHLHRQGIYKNANIILPFADYLLGETATPDTESMEEMKRFGYL